MMMLHQRVKQMENVATEKHCIAMRTLLGQPIGHIPDKIRPDEGAADGDLYWMMAGEVRVARRLGSYPRP